MIQEAITAAKCVIVLWSKQSIVSDWVKEEATIGKRRQILVPAKIDSVDPPLGFGLIQAADLTDWEAETSHTGFEDFLSAISDIIGAPLQREKGDKIPEIYKSSIEQQSEMQPEKGEIPQPAFRQPEFNKVKPSELKPNETATTDSASPEPREKNNVLRLATVAGVIVLLIAGIWWWVSRQQVNEVRQENEKFDRQAMNLENSVAEVDNQEQLKDLSRQRDALSIQVEGFSEQATKVGLGSQLEKLKKRLKQIQIQLANKEKELIAAPKGKIFVTSKPDNASVKILNIDEPFQQGMELEPGKYQLQASSEGYEAQDRRIELGPGEEKQINFDLEKIIPKFARLHVETVPEDATVRILNIKPKFVQGMELEPDRYHVEVAAEGYETERRWIHLVVENEKSIRFNLIKIRFAEQISPQKTITNNIGMNFVLIPAGTVCCAVVRGPAMHGACDRPFA